MRLIGRTFIGLGLITACAGGQSLRAPAERRIPDSAPERHSGLQQAIPEIKAETVEERFAPEAARERREAAPAREQKKTRLEVIEKPARSKKKK
jgi:hypothetical protein